MASVFTVPALPTMQNGWCPAARSAAIARAIAPTSTWKAPSTGIRRSAAAPRPSTTKARLTELCTSSEA